MAALVTYRLLCPALKIGNVIGKVKVPTTTAIPSSLLSCKAELLHDPAVPTLSRQLTVHAMCHASAHRQA